MKPERSYLAIKQPVGIAVTTLEGASDNPFRHS
jgi:hypothetical protein